MSLTRSLDSAILAQQGVFPTVVPFRMSRTKESTNEDNTATPEASDLATQLAVAKQEAAASQDRYLRMAADLENFRRRVVREKDELQRYSVSRVIENLMPALDGLSLALAAVRQPNADPKSVVGGVELVLQQLKTALASHGLKEINPAGLAFDPHEQEAISHEPSDEVAAEHVLSVVRPGYSLNGRLLRPASVIVSSGPAAGGRKS